MGLRGDSGYIGRNDPVNGYVGNGLNSAEATARQSNVRVEESKGLQHVDLCSALCSDCQGISFIFQLRENVHLTLAHG